MGLRWRAAILKSSWQSLAMVWCAIAVVWVIIFGVMSNPLVTADFAQSDTLLPADWFHSISHFPADWRWFKLPQVLSLLPDLLAYTALSALLGGWRPVMLAYAIMSALALGGMGGLAAARANGIERRAGVAAGLSLVGLAMLWSAHQGRGVQPDFGLPTGQPGLIFVSVLLPVTHGGPFLLSMGAACWVSRLVRQRRAWTEWGGLLILLAAGMASDQLFLIEAIIPLLLASLMLRVLGNSLPLAPLWAIAIAASIVGSEIPQLLYHGFIPIPQLSHIQDAIARWAHDLPALPNVEFALALLLVALLVTGWCLRPQGTKKFRAQDAQFLWVFGTLAGLGGLAATVVFYADSNQYRYSDAVLWWPLFLLSGALLRAFRNQAGQKLCAALALLAIIAVQASFGSAKPLLLRWHSRLEGCLANERSQQGLHDGLATYWLARSLAASSDFAWQIDAINEQGLARPWGNDTKAYFRDQTNPAQKPFYDFIVVSSDVDRQAVTNLFGKPDHVTICPSAQIWEWHDTNHLQPILIHRSDALTDELRLENLL